MTTFSSCLVYAPFMGTQKEFATAGKTEKEKEG